ncbi:MAG: hypothetical protein A3G33_01305 [Omnitrophica bacterium RIFCSPLOWO2_12_FULL_44_17]|uniref:Uncharacterized protein n=1 Tax=Candidatus Danuiimicrobium aquiferis TaxID=1801832 RepID=A0A1G1L1M8_9BACT|nr:MAG: hypothetical protein A3B72_00535 [Omnitrophica bacterium RIFCSPHIGHO2_02_FULL_45_28]OGW90413.1 MAG: hypothetical protein A3E74_06870 [Omnitrophica bacterium RIFCSPHIGHO2_12_FULL_44_12]OGW99041.1 MAG: hypothetical protein A3G33_01305 [Omnitrophica bacterium RIFCSPLOWO2_12_FULL_44_17]OGX04117.1 MAG: hypothetical protein A3J12_10955 [Omnitrophica bacterium RIFCSPLOWO2_02_FULL_44_11]
MISGLVKRNKFLGFCALVSVFLISFSFLSNGFAQTDQIPKTPQASSEQPSVNYLFRDSFYANPNLKAKYDITEVEGLLLVKNQDFLRRSNYSIVTGFEGSILESRVLKNVRSKEEAQAYIEKNLRKIHFERIPIRELPLVEKNGTPTSRFWVGQRAFSTLEDAKTSVVNAKTMIETDGGNFDKALELVEEYFPEMPGPTEEEIRANYKREEELAVKMMDWLDIGEKLYGPMTGTPIGERLLWQSFGETSFRDTNLSNHSFDGQTGYWTNRLVFKGLRFLGEPTLDPYVEVTAAADTEGLNYPKHLDLIGGVEYRPLGRAAFLENFNLYGLNVLKFARSYRLYVQYMERKNLTDEIEGSRDTDLWAGLDIFYEWGIDLEQPWVGRDSKSISNLIRNYVWGEYYGNYRWEKTDFTTNEHFHSWILNSTVTFGIKWPRIDLPKNPINDEFLLMPYLRFEQTTNPNREFSFQNQMYMAAGVRWMPFRSYQFMNNEWLFKTKLFAEYAGIGGIGHPGPAGKSPDTPDYDWRFGVNVSFKRY